MYKFYDEKYALITGGHRRVGRYISLSYAEKNCNVIIHYRNTGEESLHDAEDTAEECRNHGVKAFIVDADLTSALSIRAMFDTIRNQITTHLHFVVNSASAFTFDNASHFDEDNLHTELAVNVTAPRLIIELASDMVDGLQSVVNILDIGALHPQKTQLAHAVSKSALLSLTENAALFYAAYNIRVNAITAGYVLAPEGMNSARWAQISAQHRLTPYSGSPYDITGAISYLDNALFVTGSNLVVNGGEHLL